MPPKPQRHHQTTISLSGRIGYGGIHGEGRLVTEDGDQSKLVHAIAVVVCVAVGVLPALGVAALCLLLPGVPVWLTVGLPVLTWVATCGLVHLWRSPRRGRRGTMHDRGRRRAGHPGRRPGVGARGGDPAARRGRAGRSR